jgi:H+/Cl- antiporter ClcA
MADADSAPAAPAAPALPLPTASASRAFVVSAVSAARRGATTAVDAARRGTTTAVDAARRGTTTAVDAARRGTTTAVDAARRLRDDVDTHEESHTHSSLQSNTLSILDVYDGPGIVAALAAAEETERRQKQRGGPPPPQSHPSVSDAPPLSPTTTTSARAPRPSTFPLARGRQLPSSPPLFCRRLASRLRARVEHFTASPRSWLFLAALGLLLSLTAALLVDLPVARLLAIRNAAAASAGSGGGYFLWLLWCVAGALVAASVGHLLTPLAEGSGLPQLKSILAGTPLPQYLTPRVGLAKLLGLVAAQGAGLSVGREGPFVHVASVLAAQLWRIPYFASVARSESRRRQVLAAAVAAGVTAVFGTPVGGVLFAVEVTSTYFLVEHYFSCFVCAILCRLGFDIVGAVFRGGGGDDGAGGAGGAGGEVAATNFPAADLDWQTLAFALLGVASGLLGSAFVYLVNKAVVARKLLLRARPSANDAAAHETRRGPSSSSSPTSPRSPFPHRRYILAAAVASFVATVTYSARWASQREKDALSDLFSSTPGWITRPGGAWAPADGDAASSGATAGSLLVALALFVPLKLLTTVASIALPIPSGLFVPLFVTGAALGRLWGELLAAFAGSAAAALIHPGAYAVVGAAATVSGATHTVSTAVIVFELTGQATHLTPVLLASLLAISTSSIFTVGIYDALLLLSGLPYLPRVVPSALYARTAGDLLHKPAPAADVVAAVTAAAVAAAAADEGTTADAAPVAAASASPFLTLTSTYAEARALLSLASTTSARRVGLPRVGTSSAGGGADDDAGVDAFLAQLTSFPVVADATSLRLVGSVSRAALEAVFSDASNGAALGGGLGDGAENEERRGDDGDEGEGRIPPIASSSSSTSAPPLVVAYEPPPRDALGAALSPVRVVGPGRASAPSARRAGAAAPTSVASDVLARASRVLRRGRRAFFRALGEPDGGPGGRSNDGEEEDDDEGGGDRERLVDPDFLHDQIVGGAAGSGAAAAGGGRAAGGPAPIPLDEGPFTLSTRTPLARVHFLFALGIFAEVIVTDAGGDGGGEGGGSGGGGGGGGVRLAGVIGKQDLMGGARSARLAGQEAVGGEGEGGEAPVEAPVRAVDG